jgi:hypothetical protein
MDTRERTEENKQAPTQPSGDKNPFENKQPVEKDIEQSAEELEKEQQFKEAQTERD